MQSGKKEYILQIPDKENIKICIFQIAHLHNPICFLTDDYFSPLYNPPYVIHCNFYLIYLHYLLLNNSPLYFILCSYFIIPSNLCMLSPRFFLQPYDLIANETMRKEMTETCQSIVHNL